MHIISKKTKQHLPAVTPRNTLSWPATLQPTSISSKKRSARIICYRIMTHRIHVCYIW